MTIQRVFLDWTAPALPAAADYLIQRYVSDDQLDLSGVVLVFPGRRAARRMLELLVEKAADRWPDLLPPTMTTFDRFPEMLYPQQQELADDLTQLLVWKKALSSVPKAELKAALPHIPDDDAVPSWLSLCETLRGQHNELAADGMEFDQVQQELINAGHAMEAKRWKALRRLQAEYLMQMDALQRWDRQAARLVAVDRQECRSDGDIILVGTVDMNRIVRRMIDQISSRVTVLIHAPESEQHSFDQHGCLIPAAWEDRLLNIPESMVRIVDSPSDQAAAAVKQLSALGGQYRADDVAIGLANDHLVPTMMQGLANAGLAGRWPVGLKIASSRPYRLLDAIVQHLASARNGMPADFSTLSDLVRHPDVGHWINRQPMFASSDDHAAGNIVSMDHPEAKRVSAANKILPTSDRDWLTDLDRYLADHLPLTPGVILGNSTGSKVVAALCDCVERLLAELLPPALSSKARILNLETGPGSTAKVTGRKTKTSPNKGTVSRSSQRQLTLSEADEPTTQSAHSLLSRQRTLLEWAEGAVRLLGAVYRDTSLNEDSLADRAIVDCVNKLQDLTKILRQVPDAVMPRTSCVQALQLILRQVANGHVAPQADDQAIDLMGWLELSLDDSPVVIVAGFNEGYVPESINSDVFLPNSFRQQLGLTDNARRYARDAYALTTLMQNREKLCLIAGKTDQKGNPVAPSRLWFAADPESLPRRVRMFFGEPEPTEPEPTEPAATTAEPNLAGNHTAAPATRRSGFIIPPPPSGFAAPAEISVTAFRDYMQCPYRYFLRRELRLKHIDDQTRELSAAAFGSLVHEVLNRFGKSQFRDATTPESIETFLLEELRKLALARFGRDRSATVAVQLKMLENRMQKFAQWQAQSAHEGWRIIHTEADLKYSGFSDRFDRPVTLIGRIDRIDQHQTSKDWRVLDYKTSEAADKPESTHRKNDEWIDLQLPLYELLVQSMGIRGQVRLGYVNLPGDLSKIDCQIADWAPSVLDSAKQKAREVAADIIDLKIDRVMAGDTQWQSEFSRLCQDRVIDRNIPWLADWPGR